jgi:hypothetical protein
MKKSLVALSLALTFGLSVLTTNVLAADSTGTFEGWIKCIIYPDDGAKIKTGRQDLIVLVNQGLVDDDGTSNLNMNFNFFASGRANGTQFDNASNLSAKGFVGAVSCNNNGDAFTHEFVANATLKKADQQNAELKGTAAFTEDDRHGTCKWKVTRTSIPPPVVLACGE